ncbi:MAG: type II CAAX endopeptidase family protein [Acidobacteriota bacterium]
MLDPVAESSAAPPPAESLEFGVSAGAAPAAPPQPRLTRGRALIETVICSSYPTQLAAAAVLAAAGVPPLNADGGLNAVFVFAVSTLDAMMVVALILYFLRRSHDSASAVFFGARSPWREAGLGIAIVPLVTLGIGALVLAARTLVPGLHNVPVNPLSEFMADAVMAVLFGVVVVLAGGVREEMQRAFQLHRLSHHVCPPLVALALTSIAFGLGHTVQGRDVAFATFGLGVLWGAMYLRRGSLVAAAVSHSLFNLGQIAIGWWAAGQAAALK